MRVTLLAVAMLVAACSQPHRNIASDADFIALKSQTEVNSRLIQAVSEENYKLSQRVASLEGAASPSISETAYLDPAGGTGYQVIATNVTPVLVSFVGSSAVGDGTRVRLQVGNMTAATFNGAKITATYNKRMPQGDGVAAWSEALRSADVRITDRIAPGAWSYVDVSLPGIKPDELGFLTVKVNLDVLSLRGS